MTFEIASFAKVIPGAQIAPIIGPLGNLIGVVGPDGKANYLPRFIGEKLTVTTGLTQTADQVIGSIAIPAGSLQAGDVFRLMATVGRDVNTDAFGSATTIRMGTAGTTADSSVGAVNLSTLFAGAGANLSAGLERWLRVVSVGANSVIELLGAADANPSWSAAGSSAAVGAQATLTGYNLATQSGFLTITTTMGAAVGSKPRTGYMRLEVLP